MTGAQRQAAYRSRGEQVNVVLRDPQAVAAWRKLVATAREQGRTLADVLGDAVKAHAGE